MNAPRAPRRELAALELQPMCERFAEEFRSAELLERTGDQTIRRISRLIIYYLGAYFCDLDLQSSRLRTRALRRPSREFSQEARHCDHDAQDDFEDSAWFQAAQQQPTRLRRWLPGLEQSEWKRSLRFGWFPRLVYIWFFASIGYLVLATYCQYGYDFEVLRMDELERRQEALGDQGPELASRLEALRLSISARMAEAKVSVDRLDPSYSHLNILVECFYLCIVMICGMLTVPLWAHHRFWQPFDYCHLVRELLDPRYERAHIRHLTGLQVAKLVDSSRVFSENVQRLALPANRRLCRRERALNQMVHSMLARGALTPLFRLRSWARRSLLYLCLCALLMIVYTLIFFCALSWTFFSSAKRSQENSAHSHWLIEIVSLSAIAVATPTCTLHPPIFIVTVREQINYVAQLRAMIRQCIDQNSILAAALVARASCAEGSAGGARAEPASETSRAKTSTVTSTSSRGPAHMAELVREAKVEVEAKAEAAVQMERTMNSNLIFVLLHYKIFVAQMKPMRNSLGFINIIALSLLFLVPIVTRINQPYLSKLYAGRVSTSQIRIFATLISASILVPSNLMSTPLCHMFARCKDLYRDLSSLMAHLSEVRAQHGGRTVYDSYAESCLLKELADSRRLLDHLTARACGIGTTYTMHVKVLFWYGLLAISIMVDTDHAGNGQELFAALLNDPLGVYWQIK